MKTDDKKSVFSNNNVGGMQIGAIGIAEQSGMYAGCLVQEAIVCSREFTKQSIGCLPREQPPFGSALMVTLIGFVAAKSHKVKTH